VSISGDLKMEKDMEKEYLLIKNLKMFTQVFGNTVRSMVMEHIHFIRTNYSYLEYGKRGK